MTSYRQMVNQPVTMDLHVKTILLPNKGLVRDFAVFVGIDSCGKSVRCTGYFPGLNAMIRMKNG